MVKILEDEGYSRTQAIQKIVDDHKDLKGFSQKTIYRQLPDSMKDEERGRAKKQHQLVQPNISNEILVQPNNDNNNNNKLPTAYELSNNTASTTTSETSDKIDDLDKYEQERQYTDNYQTPKRGNTTLQM